MAVVETERRLAAIMLADIAGFSSLMERDEGRTFTRVRNLREQLAWPSIAKYGGRVIKTTGDGFLAEFLSATAALECGIDIQRQNHQREQTETESDRLHMRIGINVGDIIIDGDDVAGDGVNIAARLEPLAPWDGLCVSSMVREQVRKDLGVMFEDLGEQQVKNISRPIRAYRLDLFPKDDFPSPRTADNAKSRKRSMRSILGAMAMLVVVAILSGIAWHFLKPSGPPGFSIVVLPFSNTSVDSTKEFIADGITDEITVQLSKIRGSFVIGRNTAFTFKNKAVDLRSIAKELGVRYILQGTTSIDVNGVHVSVQLVEGKSGANIWADTFESRLGNLPDLRKQVVSRIAVALNLQLITAEAKKAESSNNSDATELCLRAWARYNQSATKDSAEGALKFFEKALEIDPHFEPALAGRARALAAIATNFPGSERQQQIVETERSAREAIALDPSDPIAHHALARSLGLQTRNGEAISANSQALDLNPNYVDALSWHGFLHILNAQASMAIPPASRALELSPLDPARSAFMFTICHANMHLGKYQEAVNWCEKSASISPNWGNTADLVAGYTALGEKASADIAKEKLLKIHPGVSITWYRNLRFSNNPVWLKEVEEHIWANLRKAGIPD